jgi:hypothetical protein
VSAPSRSYLDNELYGCVVDWAGVPTCEAVLVLASGEPCHVAGHIEQTFILTDWGFNATRRAT